MNVSSLFGEPFLQAFLLTVLMALSQYIVLRAGVYSVATAGFMCIGAYTSAILVVNHGWAVGPAMLVSIAVAMVVGAALGRLIEKLRGAYQAMATFAFVLVVQLIAFTWEPLTGGMLGMFGIPFWMTSVALILLALGTTVLVLGLELTTLGRQQRASFYDEVAAASVGVNVASKKLLAVVLSAGVGGLAGAALAGNFTAVDSSVFGFSLIVTVLSCVIIGGRRSVLGPIVGAFLVVALPLVFSGYATFAAIVVALATVLMLVFVPGGATKILPFDATSFYLRLNKIPEQGDQASQVSRNQEFLSNSRASADPLLVEHVSRSFGAVTAVNDVSVEVYPGHVVGLIGPNGAGKTTLMNLVAGVSALDHGTISIGGNRLEKLPPFKVEQSGISRTFQTCKLFAETTVWENVLLAAKSGRSRSRRAEFGDAECALAALELTGSLEYAHRIASELPYTHQRKVEIARALATEPRFVLLDEPAAGMPESEATELADVVRTIAAHGVGVLVIDHNVSWICSISERVLVQNFGSVIADGDPGTIIDNPLVIEAYIGAAEPSDAADIEAGAIDA